MGWGTALRSRIVLLVLVGATGGVVASRWSSLPERVAVHWGWDGRPDGFAPRALVLVLLGASVAVTCFALWRSRSSPPAAQGGAVLAAALIASVTALVAVANGSGSGSGTRVSWLAVAAVVGVPIVSVLIVRGRVPAEPPAPRGARARSRVRWRGHARARWPLWIGGGFAVSAGVLMQWDAGVAVGAGVAAVATVAFTAIRVTVDDGGVEIRYFGGLAWPRTRIRTGAIERVDVIEVVPRERGGWGYRGSLRLFGKAAVVVRRGEGILLALRGDRVFVVSVDHAEEARDAIRGLIQAREDGGR